MARIVAAFGTSHSPQLSMPAETWGERGQEDRRNRTLYTIPEGRHVDFDELMQAADPAVARELGMDIYQRRFDQNQQGISAVAAAVAEAKLDVLLAVGDDQQEAYKDDNMPAFAVFWGDKVPYYPRDYKRMPPSFAATFWAYPKETTMYENQPELALHLIESLMDQGFDVAHSKYYSEGQSITHSVQFVTARILGDKQVPIVPVIQNTYFPPNQPRPWRSYEFGQALRNAVETWKPGLRVGIIASGGLSHFVVDEELDRGVLKALEEQDVKYLTSIPVERIQSGTSEIRNWITIAGAAQHLRAKAIDYVPCYRSLAGTGCGMGFAKWV
jgi:3-O-methylgallate 3,4-dioxygenase